MSTPLATLPPSVLGAPFPGMCRPIVNPKAPLLSVIHASEAASGFTKLLVKFMFNPLLRQLRF